ASKQPCGNAQRRDQQRRSSTKEGTDSFDRARRGARQEDERKYDQQGRCNWRPPYANQPSELGLGPLGAGPLGVVEDSHQQAAFRDTAERTQRPPDTRDRCEHTADRPAGNRSRRHVQRQRRRPDGVEPPRAKPKHHQPRISQCSDDAQYTAQNGEQYTFLQKQLSNTRGPETDGSEQSDFTRALLDAQLEEQRHQQQRGNDDEEAEVDEVLAKVRRAS